MAKVSGKPRIFVTQPIADSAMQRLRALGSVKVFPDDSRIIPQKTLIAAVKKADILFCLLHDDINRAVIAANPKLRLIAAQSISPSNIDVAEASKRGIPVTVVPPVTTEATADLTFGLMIAVARRMVEADRLVRAGKFPGGQSRHLLGSIVHGRTLGLIGGGGLIGKAVARRGRGFAMRVLYWTPRRKPEAEEREAGLSFVEFDDLLRESDFVSIHSPMNGTTRHQIGARELGLMKKTAFLINTARGPIVDEKALVRAQSASRQRHRRGARADGEHRDRQYRGAAQWAHAAQLRQPAGVETMNVMAELATAIPSMWHSVCHPRRDHRVTPLRGGPVMTKNGRRKTSWRICPSSTS
jgi:glyoxylate reductase